MGELLALFPARTCFTCTHARFNEEAETRCSLYGEPVDSEHWAAQDCLGYEHCNEGDQPEEESWPSP